MVRFRNADFAVGPENRIPSCTLTRHVGLIGQDLHVEHQLRMFEGGGLPPALEVGNSRGLLLGELDAPRCRGRHPGIQSTFPVARVEDVASDATSSRAAETLRSCRILVRRSAGPGPVAEQASEHRARLPSASASGPRHEIVSMSSSTRRRSFPRLTRFVESSSDGTGVLAELLGDEWIHENPAVDSLVAWTPVRYFRRRECGADDSPARRSEIRCERPLTTQVVLNEPAARGRRELEVQPRWRHPLR